MIRFYGVSPQAAAEHGHDQCRALVTIEIFELDNLDSRKNLLLDRARIILALYPQLEKLADGTAGNEKKKAQDIVDLFTASTSPHTNCARSFKSLFEHDRDEAQSVINGTLQLLISSS